MPNHARLDRKKIPHYWREILAELPIPKRNMAIFGYWVDGATLEEIGRLSGGLTKERVRQIRNKTLKKIELAYAHKIIDADKERQ